MKKLDSLTSFAARSLALLCCTWAFASCSRDDSIGNNVKRDAAPDLAAPDAAPDWGPGSPDLGPLGPDALPGPDGPASPADAWSCSLPSRVDDAGVTQWSWRLQWWATQGELADTCATYGAGATMVMEVDFPKNPSPSTTLPSCTTDEVINGSTRACMMADAFRFVADCTAKELVFELPSENTFHGYFHIEGPAVAKTMRYLLGQNVDCDRQVFTRTGVSALPTPDGGPDSFGPGDGPVCGFDGGGLPGSYPDCVANGGKVISATATTPAFCVETYLENYGNRTDYARCRAVGGYTGMFDVFGCDGPIGGGYCQVYYPQNGCPTVTKPSDYWWPIPSCNDFVPPTSPNDAGPVDGPTCSFADGGILPASYDACVAAGGKVVAATSLAPTFCEMLYDTTLFPTRPGFEQCRAVGGYLVAWDGDAAGGTTCFVFYPQNGCPTGPKPDGWTWSY